MATAVQDTSATSSRLLELYGKFAAHPRLAALNEAAAKRFAEVGIPGKRHEMFSFVNLRELLAAPFEFRHGAAKTVAESEIRKLVFAGCEHSLIAMVDGRYEPALSDVTAHNGAVTAQPLEQAITTPILEQLVKDTQSETDVFAVLNAMFVSGGVLIEVKNGADLSTPIQILHLSTGEGITTADAPRVVISVGANAAAQVAEKFAGSGGFLNAVTNLSLGEGANVQWTRLQTDADAGFHFSKTHIRMARDSRFKGVAAANGGKLARHNCEVRLTGEGAELTQFNAAVLDGAEQSHNYFRIHHEAPNCVSYEVFKHLVMGRSAASADTTVVVHPGAQLTVSDQLINNLMLSEETRADTKPNLMIYADDVKCKHGATVGRLDENQIFYMVSRGISADRARALLTAGFVKSVLAEVAFAPVAQEAANLLLAKLEKK